MRTDKTFCIAFSGLKLKFIPHSSVTLPEEFLPLLTEDFSGSDASYHILPLEHPLATDFPSHSYHGAVEYQTPEGRLRVYSLHRSGNGAQVACLLRPDNNHILYYPAPLWDHYTSPLHCSHLIGLETVMIQRDAFLLHSSVVRINGKAVLFCGPSGAGKSTQADLWQTHLGADILNGDRCLIMRRTDGFYGGGSPLAGHSHVYRPEQAPIAAIFLVEHCRENIIAPMGINALSPLLSQTLLNSWDGVFMERLTALYQQLLCYVPVYRLRCRPDEDAVRLAHTTIF